MFTRTACVLTLSLGLGGCFKLPLTSTGKIVQGSAVGETQAAVSTNIGETKAIATIDPDSKTATKLTAPRVDGLNGASVVIPPGSLGIAADIVVEQAADFGETSMGAEMGLAADIQVSSASPGMIIRPTESVDLKKPLSLAMPLPSGVGFRLADVGSKYAIFYKYFDPTEGRLVTGFKVVDGVNVKLAFDEKSGYDILQFEGYFGAYWATKLSREVKPSEVPPPKPAEAPIVNKANVSVIETKGIVKETEIVKTQAIPPMVWGKPSIKFAADSRVLSVSIPVPTGRTVNGCKIDLYENPTKPDGVSLESPFGTSIEYSVVRATEHSLVGRFRCFDDQGRTTITPWSEALTIPAVIVAAAPVVTDGTCASPQVAMEARPFGRDTGESELLPAVGKCSYAGDLMMNEVDRFYIARADSSMVCGLSDHTLVEGVQTLKCIKATSANVGGDYLTIARGNYSYRLDFSKSATEPTLTIARLGCAMADMHILFYDNYITQGATPPFPAIASSNKMTHIGGCEFVFDSEAAPYTSTYAKVTFKSADTTPVYCGEYGFNDVNATNKMDDHQYTDRCSTTPRYFNLPATEAGISGHHFSVRLGPSAKEHNNSATSIVQYERESSCPRQLYLYSNAGSLLPVRDLNDSEKKGACSYEWYYAADYPIADVAFRIGDETKTKMCGFTTADPSDASAVTCSGSYEITPASYQAGQVYRVTASGNGATGVIDNIQINPLTTTERTCDHGLYSSPSIANGYYNKATEAFVEVKECVFERVWIPTAAQPGFYLHGAKQTKICGSDGSPDRQLTANGSESTFWCDGDANKASQMSAITPLNAAIGSPHKIVADLRFPYQARVKVMPDNNPASCADDVYMNGNGAIPGSAKMTSLGNCNYSYDFATGPGISGYQSYRITVGSTTCGLSSGFPNTSGIDRAATLNCPSGEYLNVYVQPNETYRWYVKREATTDNASFVMQNISRDLSNFKFSGDAGVALGSPNFGFANLYPNNGQPYDTFDWTVSGPKRFLVERNNGGPGNKSYCALALNAALPGLAPTDMICNVNSAALMTARYFENSWIDGQSVRVHISGPSSYEGPYQITAAVANQLNYPQLRMLRGFDGNGGGYTISPASIATPQALASAATWTEGNNLWLYGGQAANGDFRGELWKFDGTNWNLVWNNPVDPVRMTLAGGPGGRRGSTTWMIGRKLYLFGGYGIGNFNSNPVEGFLSDLWSYDLDTPGWTLVRGDMNVNTAGTTPTLNMPSASVYPQSREGAKAWIASSGEVYLFGGKLGNNFYANDMWSWNSSTGDWKWIAGNADAQSGSASLPSPRAFASGWDMPGDDFYLYGGTTIDNGSSSNEMWRFSGGTWFREFGDDSNATYNDRRIVRARSFDALNNPGFGVNDKYSSSVSWLANNGDMYMYQQGVLWRFNPGPKQWAAMLQQNQEGELMMSQPMAYVQDQTNFSTQNRMGLRQGANVWVSGARVFLMGGNSGINVNAYRNDLWEISLP